MIRLDGDAWTWWRPRPTSAGEHAAAQVTAARAAGIGRLAGEADLVGLALFFQGAATVAGGPGGTSPGPHHPPAVAR